MKRMLKYIILLLFIPFFINAEEICNSDSIIITDVEVTNNTGNVIEKTPLSFDGKNVNINLEMQDVGDKISYEIKIKNDSNVSYELEEPNVNLNSDYLKYEYEYENGKIIEPKEEKKLYLNIEYENVIPRKMFSNGVYDENKSVLLSLSSDNNEELINPKTGLKNTTLLILISLFVSGIVLIILCKSKIGYTFIFITFLMSIPYVKAICKCDINLNTNVQIIKEPEKACTFDGELVQGAEFKDGNFIYRYKQENEFIYEGDWGNIDIDGWGAYYNTEFDDDWKPIHKKLDKKEQVCTSINGKPIVSAQSMFLSAYLDNIDFETFDTSHIINMNGMFESAISTVPIDLSFLDISKVKNMQYMFSVSEIPSLNLSGLKLNGDISRMFNGAKINNLIIDDLDISNVTNMDETFRDFDYDKLDLSKLDFSNVTSLINLFAGSSFNELKLGNFNSIKANNLDGIFSGTTIKNFDVNYIDAISSTSLNNMFSWANITNLDLSKIINTENITDISYMFAGYEGNIPSFKNINTSNVTNMSSIFSHYKNQNFNIGDLNINTSNVTNFGGMFSYSEIDNLIFSGIDTRNAEDFTLLFAYSNIGNIIIDNIETPKLKTLDRIFAYSKVNNADLGKLDTSNVTSITSGFEKSEINNLDLYGWNTLKMTDLKWLFQNSKIPTLDLSSFDLSSSSSISSMFNNCSATIGYAKNSYMLDRFNAVGVTKKPTNLEFTIKLN